LIILAQRISKYFIKFHWVCGLSIQINKDDFVERSQTRKGEGTICVNNTDECLLLDQHEVSISLYLCSLAFVQGAVIDPATGAISIYNPLVLDQGTQAAAQPVVPQLPANGIVALWFGSNGNNLTLQGTNGSLRQGRCVNGANGSIFGQFSYCNARAFFRVANRAIQAGLLKPPALGVAKDGQPCPSVRDFGLVDMDQSDNVVTTYLVTASGQTAQMTAANVAALQNTQTQTNGSDNRLLAIALDGALGCTPWMASDLADPGHLVPALPLNELQASVQQAAPVALVPAGDPMVLNNNQPDLNKLIAITFLPSDQPAFNGMRNLHKEVPHPIQRQRTRSSPFLRSVL
jgi:hypothetical protein